MFFPRALPTITKSFRISLKFSFLDFEFDLNLTISFEFPPFRVRVSLIKLPVKELHGDSFVFIEYSSAAIIKMKYV
jgi:hypothetical protein